MKLLTLTIPGPGNHPFEVPNFPGFSPGPGNPISSPDLAGIINGLLDIAITLSAFLAFFWLIWGVFQYIFAGGDKEKLSKAKSRITWAIVGFLIVALALTIAQFAGNILKAKPEQTLPGFSLVPQAHAFDIGAEFGLATPHTTNLGDALGLLVNPAFSIAMAATVVYFLIGAFKWLSSGGDKEAIASARAMMTHAIIGFLLLFLSFALLQFIPQLFGLKVPLI